VDSGTIKARLHDPVIAGALFDFLGRASSDGNGTRQRVIEGDMVPVIEALKEWADLDEADVHHWHERLVADG
jgi:hypothetical protein